eukprot:gnl/TRDRNA2_/TRDRNA2_127773_c0_seq1.p1 gnl/TRDRNA2_/TRDRNA2_127773_c0~~gnl/TRDRNA2_/TRDRNA2_127773_c0_seq1.p1  ORF type:complete len:226 (+),score=23.86 gnl/TRDRNA2_/TRDRNA2_127773_c0_seq1:52-729(+)
MMETVDVSCMAVFIESRWSIHLSESPLPLPCREALTGALAATGAALGSNPFDVLKSKLQVQGQQNVSYRLPYASLLESLRHVISREGLWSLQQGLAPAMCYNFVFNLLRFGSYDVFLSQDLLGRSDGDAISMTRMFAAGCFAGALGGMVASPLAMVRVQMQTKSLLQEVPTRQAMGMLVALQNAGGMSGLFRGAHVQAVRMTLGTGTQFLVYDRVKSKLVSLSAR